MSPLSSQSYDLISAVQRGYADYHARKEGRTWAAAVLFVGGLITIALHDFSKSNDPVILLVFLLALAFSWMAALFFLVHQYRDRQIAAWLDQACSNVLADWIGNKEEPGEGQLGAVCLPPRNGQAGAKLPKLVVDAFEEQKEAHKDRGWPERWLVIGAVAVWGVVALCRVLVALNDAV